MHSPPARPRILVVEDDHSNRVLLARLLEQAGYAVDTAEDGLGAIVALEGPLPDLVLLDVGLPGVDDLEVCRRVRADGRLVMLPIILVTGRGELDDVVAGLDAGADDFLSKPYRQAELLARIRSSLRLRRAMAEMEAAHGVVAALANAVEAKDVTTEHHCQRLAGYAYRLATAAGVTGPELKGVVFGALLHDVGKIGISEDLLTRAGPLNAAETAVMRRHPVIGEEICRPLNSSPLFSPIVRHHHERWDGSGYPDRLRGRDIPLGARIVSLVDSFDAITNDRPYQAARALEVAVEEIGREAGRHFDPDLAGLFVGLIKSDPAELHRKDLPAEALVAVAAAGQ